MVTCCERGGGSVVCLCRGALSAQSLNRRLTGTCACMCVCVCVPVCVCMCVCVCV